MKPTALLAALLLTATLLAHAAGALAPTPPMGWNSWDCYGTTVTEAEVKANAAYMAEHLKQHGWQYVVIDIQWSEPDPKAHGYRAGARACDGPIRQAHSRREPLSILRGGPRFSSAGRLHSRSRAALRYPYYARHSTPGREGESAGVRKPCARRRNRRHRVRLPVEQRYVRRGPQPSRRAGLLRFHSEAVRRVGRRLHQSRRYRAAGASRGDCRAASRHSEDAAGPSC